MWRSCDVSIRAHKRGSRGEIIIPCQCLYMRTGEHQHQHPHLSGATDGSHIISFSKGGGKFARCSKREVTVVVLTGDPSSRGKRPMFDRSRRWHTELTISSNNSRVPPLPPIPTTQNECNEKQRKLTTSEGRRTERAHKGTYSASNETMVI